MVDKDMAMLRYIRHEMFAKEYILNGGNATEAYQKVIDKIPRKCKRAKNRATVRVMACVIAKRPDVKKRIWELREKMAKKADITMDKVLTDIQEAIQMAKLNAKPSEVITGAMAQARLVGLDRTRVETGAVGDFDGIEDLSEILDKVGKEAGPEAALALAQAFGLSKPESDELAEAIPPSDAVN